MIALLDAIRTYRVANDGCEAKGKFAMARRHRQRARRARYPDSRSRDALKANDPSKEIIKLVLGVR
jgi:hypothetical protein